MSMGDHKYCNCCCHQVYMPIGRPTQTDFLEAHIDTLKSQLTSALSREKALREALEIARQILKGQPEPREIEK